MCRDPFGLAWQPELGLAASLAATLDRPCAGCQLRSEAVSVEVVDCGGGVRTRQERARRLSHLPFVTCDKGICLKN